MNNFVISLSNAAQRRAHICSEFAKEEVDFEFFDAITPATLQTAALTLGLDASRTDLHQNEVACFLSHVMLWKRAVDEKIDYIAIFEDDIYLGQQAFAFLMDSAWIPPTCNIIKLETLHKKILLPKNQSIFPLPFNRKLMFLGEAHMGAGGYVLSLDAAKKLSEFVLQLPKLIPIDHILFREYPESADDKVYQLSPAICIQDVILTKGKTNFPSSLESVRNERKGEDKTKKKLNLLGKLKREMSRLVLQLLVFAQDQIQSLRGKSFIKIKFK